MTILNKFLLFFSVILFLIILSTPKQALAEIATTKDWIGLFPAGIDSYSKGATLTSTPSATFIDGHAWAYTSSCTQTAGTTPKLSDLTGCSFSLFPTPAPGKYYVFRLFANNEQTLDALIATSKQMYVGPAAFPTPPPSVGKLYRIPGDFTVDNNITVGLTGVVFVDGNLYIKTNLTNTNPKTGLVFVVQGTIYILRNVETVNAFLIAHGKNPDGTDKIMPFCSAWDGTTPPTADGTDCVDYPDSASQKYLTINGSVISLSTVNAPQFVRQKATATNPAETINYEPKYLVILKDVFSRDLKIWKEIQ